MLQCVLTAAAVMAGTTCPTVTVNTETILHICSNSTIRVTHSKQGVEKESLSVVGGWEKAQYTQGENDTAVWVETADVKAVGSKATGAVQFEVDGKVVLAETGYSLTPSTLPNASDLYSVVQNWSTNPKTSIYGGGMSQNGFYNYKDTPLDMIPITIEAYVPFFTTTDGYALLWDAYSFTSFNPRSPLSFPPFPANATSFNGVQTSHPFTATESGLHNFMLVSAIEPAWGPGFWTVATLTITDVASGEVQLAQNYTALVNMPNSLVGRAVLQAGRTYTATYNISADDSKTPCQVYVTLPNTGKTQLASKLEPFIDYYFMWGGSFDGMIDGYRQATGAAPLYSLKSYGFWQSRNRYPNQTQILYAAKKFRNMSFPVDSIVQDWMYWGSLGWGPHWDPAQYPDVPGMVKELHDMNYQLMVSVWPNFDNKTIFHKNMTAAGGMIGGTGFYDPYNPTARELFYQFSKTNHFDHGVDALWLDDSEPGNLIQVGNEVYLGPGERYLQSFSLVESKSIYEGLRRDYPTAQGDRVFILTRSSWAGQQRYGATLWTGDIACTFDSLRRQILGSVNYGLSGIPYWSEDIGGYFRPPGEMGEPYYQQLLIRWFQFGAFTPIFRVHGDTVTDLFDFPEATYTTINATAITFRYRLLPYTYSGFKRVDTSSWTMQRAMVMDYMEDPEVRSLGDQFMWGDAMLIAPIYTQGAGIVSRDVYLPVKDQWVDFWTGMDVPAGHVTASVPLDVFPIYVKKGSIVVMGPEKLLATDPSDPLEVRVYDGADSRFSLYEDAGRGTAHSYIYFTWTTSTKTLSVSTREGSFPGMLNTRTINVVLVKAKHGAGIPACPTPDSSITYTGTKVDVVLK